MSNSLSDYINYRISRSEELYQDAQLLYENNRWRSCVNRLYYSSFQLVSALMFKHGITTKSHDGLKTKFFQLYIKTDKISLEYGKLYSQLIDWRQESDYAEYVEFNEEDVEPLMHQVINFNNTLLDFLKEGVK